MKSNVILVDYDCPNEWEFIKGLEKETNDFWIVKKCIACNHGSKIKNLIRYLKYFYFPLIIFFNRNKYNNIIGWQQFYGIILAFYFRLFHIKNGPNIYIMTFIYKKRNSFLGKLYEKFIKYSISSEFIKGIIVFGKNEPELYSNLLKIRKNLFIPTFLGIEDSFHNFKICDNNYFFSAGRSNRDYVFLINNWNSFYKLEIVCDEFKYGEIKNNIILHTDVYGNEYLKLLSNCHAVVLSLENENTSSGQLVILQAMMMGKPVICTYNKTVENYIDSYVNGVIIQKNKESLDEALDFVNKNYEVICSNARKKYEQFFSEYNMGLNIGVILKNSSNN